MNYDLIINVLTDVISLNAETDFSPESKLAYTEGRLKTLIEYIESCRYQSEKPIKVVGGIWDGK